jgi:hypothetical protein
MTQPKEGTQHSLREHFMDPRLKPDAERGIVIHSRAPTPTSKKISAISPVATTAQCTQGDGAVTTYDANCRPITARSDPQADQVAGNNNAVQVCMVHWQCPYHTQSAAPKRLCPSSSALSSRASASGASTGSRTLPWITSHPNLQHLTRKPHCFNTTRTSPQGDTLSSHHTGQGHAQQDFLLGREVVGKCLCRPLPSFGSVLVVALFLARHLVKLSWWRLYSTTSTMHMATPVSPT